MIQPIAYLPDSFRPIAVPLVRLGSDHDGGYVVARSAIESSTHLLSFGLETNWSFETDYFQLKRSSGEFTGIDAYDPSLTRWLWVKRIVRQVGRRLRRKPGSHIDSWSSYRRLFGSPQVTHHRQWIGKATGTHAADFKTCLSRVPPSAMVFLKMDIEGSEYEILNQIIESSDRLSGIAVELHAFPSAYREHARLFDELHRRFRVVDVHVNNYGQLDRDSCPALVEVSYLHQRLVPDAMTETVFERERLNQPNRPDTPEYMIHFRAA